MAGPKRRAQEPRADRPPVPPAGRPARPGRRTTYGTGKYAALHLLFSRMFRLYAPPSVTYQYVTLGGTELRDCRTLHFIDNRLTQDAVSFEAADDRYPLAQATADHLRASGPVVEVMHDNLFQGFNRADPARRHLI